MNDGNGKVDWKQYYKYFYLTIHDHQNLRYIANHLNPLTAKVFSKVKGKKISISNTLLLTVPSGQNRQKTV